MALCHPASFHSVEPSESLVAKFNPEERTEYEDSLKAFRDWYSVLSTAEHKGFALGMEEGMAKGEKNKALAIAREMLSDSMSAEAVARYTNLSVEEIRELQCDAD